MARERSPARAEAEKLYLDSKGTMKLVDIAAKLNLKDSQIRKWKSQDKWDDKLKGALPKSNSNVTNRKDTSKARKVNVLELPKDTKSNAVSKTHPNKARPGNKNAETHGFFSKFLPESTLEIIKAIEEKDPLDIIWENIQIQYAAILRAQHIMYVDSKDEIIKEIKKKKEYSSENGESSEVEYEIEFAWNRQATFLNAQSRAMSELRSQVKQYEEMLYKNWDLATEEQKARIEVLKSKISNDDKSKEDKLDQYFKALEGAFKDDQ